MPGLRRLFGKAPAPIQESLRAVRGKLKRTLEPVDWGNLRRTQAFSDRYGTDRGTPVGRWYVDQFLAKHVDDIQGDVIELLDGRYAKSLGGDNVRSLEILDIDENNHDATLIADLGEEDSLPSASFDCFILTQTLYLIPRLDLAIKNAWRSLRPKGVLLITTPVIAPLDSIYGPDRDYWRLPEAGLRKALLQNGATHPELWSYGNLITCIASLLGLALEDLDREELRTDDPRYPVVSCARVMKDA